MCCVVSLSLLWVVCVSLWNKGKSLDRSALLFCVPLQLFLNNVIVLLPVILVVSCSRMLKV